MGIIIQRNDNLVKLLEGMSLLEKQDQERIISVVDALTLTEKKVKKEIFYDVPLLEQEETVYTDDEI
jgi:ligand-binding sensor protein